jgi:hypothetical protein
VARDQGWRGNKSGRQLVRSQPDGMTAKTRITLAEALENADNIAKEQAEREKAQAAAKVMMAGKHLTELGFVLPGQS